MSYRFGTTAHYVSSVKYAAVPVWATGVAKTVGNLVRQTTPSDDYETVFVCTIAGTTAGSEPSWTSPNKGDKFAETAGPTWVECTGMPALNGDMANTPNWSVVRNQNLDVGVIIKDIAGTHIFIVTTSGNTNNTAEPTWNTSAVGNTTTDNGVTWTYLGTSFTAWSAPFAKLQRCASFAQVSDVYQYFVGSDHNETQAYDITINAGASSPTIAGHGFNQVGPITIVCVNVAGSTPPVSADVTNTAVINTTASHSQTLNFGYVRWCYGIKFNCGSGGGGISVSLNNQTADKFYENCSFVFPSGTSSGATFYLGANPYNGKTRIKNCSFKFNDVGQIVAPGAQCTLENCTFDTSVAIPNRFLEPNNGAFCRIIGSDLSGLSGSTFVYTGGGGEGFIVEFVDCKLPSSFTPASLFNDITSLRISYTRCDNGTATYNNAVYDRSGQMTTDAGIVRTGGAGDGTTAFSWKIATSVRAFGPSQPFDCPLIANDNATTGSTVNVTVHGIVNDTALPTNDDVYATVQYLGASGNPQASFKTNKRTDFLATTSASALSADTGSAWDTAATARANSHAYSVGDIIKVASNTGRIFFCTSAGTSAGSEPGGYASAIDGGSVTDSGATFRAGVRFSFTLALSSPAPALAGPIYTTVSFGKPTPTTYFIDPSLVV